MRIIPPNRLDKAGFSPHERHFLGSWYSMTHLRSLDSHRVRCMNSRTIVRELCQELRIGLLDEDELKGLAAEAHIILSEDPVVKSDFAASFAALEPFLKSPPPAPKAGKTDGKDKAAREKFRHFRFAVNDLEASLHRNYFDRLCLALPPAIKPNNEDEISFLTGSLLSDLVDRGWTLEGLYLWHLHFINKAGEYTFVQNLQFMLKQFKYGTQKFDVTLRLSGSTQLVALGKYKGFTFAAKVDADPEGDEEVRFFAEHPSVCFGRITVQSVDSAPAAIRAREIFESLLDLLRFEYEREAVAIDETCHVKRVGDGRKHLPKIRNTVPNPIEALTQDVFLDFARRFDRVGSSNRIANNTRRRLQAAMRQCRFGRDSGGYKDKFLNWWLGLETLCYPNRRGGIGPTVTRNVAYGMLNGYLQRLVRDLLITLKYCKPEWDNELQTASGCPALGNLVMPQLIALLQTANMPDRLAGKLTPQPIVAIQVTKVAEYLTDPKATAAQLQSHLDRLRWHVARLWRIRCCIVHGSSVRFKLGLFAANLEYYLKEMILLSLDTFHHNDHVNSLDELFHRCIISADQSIARLNANGAGLNDIRDAVFANLVVQDRFT